MFQTLRNWITRQRSALPWRKLWEGPVGAHPSASPVTNPETALTVSAYWAASRLYVTTIGSLPLITYQKQATGGRDRAKNNPAYRLLANRPNPAMSRVTYFELAVNDLIHHGEHFAQIRRSEGGDLVGLYPIRPWNVVNIAVDDEWNKAYQVRTTANETEVYTDTEIIHVMWHSRDGIRGVRLLEYAGEAIGLHRQSLETASAFMRNAVRPSGYLRYKGKITKDTAANIREYFAQQFGGSTNVGQVPVVGDDGEFKPFADVTAEDAKIIEALSVSVADVARWFGLSPLLLGDLSRGTYSNLAADNAAFYQRTIRPVLAKFEAELNHKLFGFDSDTYAEFLVHELLRGDPQTQANVANLGITNGWLTRAEQREFMNLPYLPGLDQPLTPLNMAPTPPTSSPPSGGEYTNAA